jgi:hypothetical protein
MKQRIDTIDEFIRNTNIITNYGGFCVNRQPSGNEIFPKGVAVIQDKNKSNIYSYDDNYLCSGYLYLANLRSGGTKRNGIIVTLGLNVFTNILKQGNKIPFYQRPLALYGLLGKITGVEQVRIIAPTINYFQEFATIEMDFIDYAPCQLNDEGVQICL